MKKIVMGAAAVALVALGVFGTLAVQRTLEPSVSISSTSIQEQLVNCSELASAKLDYRGLVRYEDGDIDFINKKGFTMVYDAEVRAGVDLSRAGVEVSGNVVTVSLPAPQMFGIEIDPSSIEFYDSTFALFNWENKDDTAKALVVAQQDAQDKVNQTNLLSEARDQAHVLVENLLAPFEEGDNAYIVNVVDAG